MDPYEQQLLKVFNSHDIENKGSLDLDGLRQLCYTLQLEEQCNELIRCLLNEKQQSRTNFKDFKEALLNLLDKLQSNKTSLDSSSSSLIMENKSSIEKASPDREVSPKFIFGSKKYGRRSRPKTDKSIFDEDSICGDDDNDGDDDVILPAKFAGVSTPLSSTTMSVQRSNSQSEVLTKKRKTNYKLKRCTSLPGQKELNKNVYSGSNNSNTHHLIKSNLSITNNDSEILCTEEMLKEAWGKLGVGEDGYLNRSELILVCNAIGLHKLADEVIKQSDEDELSRISINYSNHKISFKDVLDVIQKDETWFNVLNNESSHMDQSINTLRSSAEELFPDSQTFHYITLGPDGNGLISTDILVEMWENVGIHSPKELIHELGFNSRNINVIDLANILEKETRTLNETTRNGGVGGGGGGTFESTHVTLLQANLTLYQTEIKCLRSILEQFQVEKEKLKLSIYEANNRATLLAQEVDDNHTRMEQNRVNQVKLLEQRHADMLKDLTLQYAKDKEQLTSINQSLEDKISALETEIAKLKNDLTVAQKYSLDIEQENHLLNGKIYNLEKDKETITGKIELLEKEKEKTREIDRQESELLLAKLHALQIKNVKLKDRNDEMETEIESLTNQIISMKVKAGTSNEISSCSTLNQSMEDEDILSINIGDGVSGSGCNNILRAKRRSDCSPSKDIQLLKINGSPRLGKLRKCYTKSSITTMSPQQITAPAITNTNTTTTTTNDNITDVPLFISSESGFDDTEPEELSTPSSLLSTSNCEQEEINRLQVKVAFLEQILMQHNIPIPSPTIIYREKEKPDCLTNRTELSKRTNELEKIIENVRREMLNVKSQIEPNASCSSCEKYRYVYDRLSCENSQREYRTFSDSSKEQECQTDLDVNQVEETVKKLENQVKELTSKCTELEDCVELLRNEYEKCEDYWQNKVDEERQFFEVEQKISGDKLNELLEKMREYEEQYANQDVIDNRLPPIAETANLEKQFTDLEQEFEDYKQFHESEMFKKDEEISELKEKICDLELKNENRENNHKQNNKKIFTSYIIDHMSRYGEEMLPPPPSTSPQVAVSQNFKSSEACSSLTQLNWTNVASTDEKESFANLVNCGPSTSSSQSSTPCRPKRTRKHERNVFKKNITGKDTKSEDIQRQHSQQQQALNATGEQNVMIPLKIINNLISRKNYLEQQIKYLQNCMKQQRCHNEQVLQYHWQQFYGECSQMHDKLKYCQEKLDQQMKISNEQLEKLHRNDLFIKDLYVENAYLYANVERLEKQCHMLSLTQQQTSNLSSV